jgi:hypothetical protein
VVTAHPAMIIHASKAFEKRFKCEVSGEGHVVLQTGRLDAWSGHFVRIRRTSYILLMNDATLYAIIIPAKGLTTFPALLKVLLPLISDLWTKHGGSFDPDNQSVIVLPRTNRSLIGSMNDAMNALRFHCEGAEFAGTPFDLARVEWRMNENPYKSLNYDHPNRLLPKMLGNAG